MKQVATRLCRCRSDGRRAPAQEGERDWILHVDLDQFLAAVEVLRRPELAGRPVVVGGDGDPTRPRQVVATASYEARAYGVRSGMPLRTAARRCPDAVFLPSDHPAYDAASDRVMAALRSLEVPVEEWGWDEACVGVRTADPEAFARRLQATVLAADAPALRGRDRRDEAPGQDGDRLRQAGRRRPPHARHVAPGDGIRAGHRHQRHRGADQRPPRRARHRHRRGARGRRPPRAGPPVRADDRSPPAVARPRRRRLAGRRRTTGAAVAQPGGHLRRRTSPIRPTSPPT